jgi:hypothetical protein
MHGGSLCVSVVCTPVSLGPGARIRAFRTPSLYSKIDISLSAKARAVNSSEPGGDVRRFAVAFVDMDAAGLFRLFHRPAGAPGPH